MDSMSATESIYESIDRIVNHVEQREALMLISAQMLNDHAVSAQLCTDRTQPELTKLLMHMAGLTGRLINIISAHTGETPDEVLRRFALATTKGTDT